MGELSGFPIDFYVMLNNYFDCSRDEEELYHTKFSETGQFLPVLHGNIATIGTSKQLKYTVHRPSCFVLSLSVSSIL